MRCNGLGYFTDLDAVKHWLSIFWLRPRPTPTSRLVQFGRLSTLCLYAYLLLGITLVFMEDELVFRAKAYPQFWIQPPNSCTPLELNLALDDGTTIHAWWFEPPNWMPAQGALVHCHGHGCNLSHIGDSALRWRDVFGRGVLLFDYPGFGKSAGTPSEEGCYAAAQTAFDWLTTTKNTKNIVVYGHSMGGAVAVDLACRRPVRALILSSSFTTMPDAARVLVRIFPTDWLMHNRFDNVAKIGRCEVPTFFAHGNADRRVPIDQGQQLFNFCPAPKKQFHVVQGGGHDLEHDTGVFQAAKQFLDSLPVD